MFLVVSVYLSMGRAKSVSIKELDPQSGHDDLKIVSEKNNYLYGYYLPLALALVSVIMRKVLNFYSLFLCHKVVTVQHFVLVFVYKVLHLLPIYQCFTSRTLSLYLWVKHEICDGALEKLQ